MKKLVTGFLVIASSAGLFNIATAQEVDLLKAASHINTKYGYKWQEVSFDIRADNLGADKRVSVYYRNNNNQWIEQAAVFTNRIDDTQDLWQAKLTIPINGPQLFNKQLDLDFSIKYNVNGMTYWDNNSNQNYQLAANAGEMITTPVYSEFAYAKAPYRYQYGNHTGNVDGDFKVSILLQDLGKTKEVKVHYSYDNWNTQHVKKATPVQSRFVGYSWATYPNTNKVENWYMRAFGPEAQGSNAKEVVYTIEYTVDGQTYWDRNFGQDYRVTIDNK